MNDTTRIVNAISQGGRVTAEDLLPVVYDELRRMAASRLADEMPGQTLQATALVHEVWLRLTDGGEPVSFENRAQFFAAAAESIRRILIERARKRNALKRGGGAKALDLEQANIAMETDDETLLVLDEALQKLERIQPAAAALVKLRFFAGMKNAEVCPVLNISERTAKRHWAYARAWLYQEIRAQQAS